MSVHRVVFGRRRLSVHASLACMPNRQCDAEHLAQARLGGIAAEAKIRTPSLWFDKQAIEHNIDAVVARIGDATRWRPHIKTHKCSEIVQLCIDRGVLHFKCATLEELWIVARAAWLRDTDVDTCCAYPFYDEQWIDVAFFAQNLSRTKVSWLVDSPEHLRHLFCRSFSLNSPLRLALDVDTGMGRSGSTPERWAQFLAESGPETWPEPHEIVLLHGYEGHLGWDEQDQANQGYDSLLALRDRCRSCGFDPEVVTSGSHSYAHALAHKGLSRLGDKSKVSPGTVVLNDLNSAPASEDLALQFGALVASRVISVRPGRVTLDAGSKAISPDVQQDLARMVGYPKWRTQVQHEEHLVMAGGDREWRFRPGDIAWLIPAHVCTTVNMYNYANFLDEDGQVSPVYIARGHPWAEEHLRKKSKGY